MVIIMPKCLICQSEFPQPQWPNTRQSMCSRKCVLKAFYWKHKKAILAHQSSLTGEARKRRLETQRKWNSSEKGKASKEKYWKSHSADRVKSYLDRYAADEQVRKVQQARISSRRKLIRHGIPQECRRCGAYKKKDIRIECHHIDENPLNREIANLEWLCKTCHSLVHSEGGLGE